MTEAEKRVIEITVELVNEFAGLPVEHPQDMGEFVAAIHRIQDMVMARPARREINKTASFNDP